PSLTPGPCGNVCRSRAACAATSSVVAALSPVHTGTRYSTCAAPSPVPADAATARGDWRPLGAAVSTPAVNTAIPRTRGNRRVMDVTSDRRTQCTTVTPEPPPAETLIRPDRGCRRRSGGADRDAHGQLFLTAVGAAADEQERVVAVLAGHR